VDPEKEIFDGCTHEEKRKSYSDMSEAIFIKET
jgi:hypothetical protein